MIAYKSSPLKFVVKGEVYFVHGDLLGKHSAPLHNMFINSGMKESEEKAASLLNVSCGTFERFLDWMYKGFYKAAKHDKVPEMNKPAEKQPSASIKAASLAVGRDTPSTFWTLPIGPSPPKKKDKKATGEDSKKRASAALTAAETKELFNNAKYTQFPSSVSVQPIRKNKSKFENYTKVFLCHAKVYVFADQWFIEDLKTLALESLHETLKLYKLYSDRVGDVVALVEYVYEHTAKSNTMEMEPMRALVMNYLACETRIIAGDPGFEKLLREDEGDLTQDFLKVVQRRV